MENNEDKGFHELFIRVKDYINTNIELKKLSLIEAIALTASSVIALIVVVIFLMMGLLFISIGAGFYFAHILDSTYLGFFMVALIYLVLMLLVYLLKDKFIKEPLLNLFIKRIFKLNQK